VFEEDKEKSVWFEVCIYLGMHRGWPLLGAELTGGEAVGRGNRPQASV